MKKTIKLTFVLIIFVLISCLSGCSFDSRYYGEYPALYTVACMSLDTDGFYADAEYECEVAVVPVETDDYGRTMFAYCDVEEFIAITFGTGTYALLICQYYDDTNAYYYRDNNFICKEVQIENGVELTRPKSKTLSTITNPLYGFSEEDIDKLKEWNDWNKPIDNDKCVSAEIITDYAEQLSGKAKLVSKEVITKIDKLPEIIAQKEGLSVDKYGSRCYIRKFDNYGNMLLSLQFYVDLKLDEEDIALKVVDKCKHYSYYAIVSKSGECLENNYYFCYNSYISITDKKGSQRKDHNDIQYESDYLYQNELKKLYDSSYWYVADIDEILAADQTG